MIHNNEVVVVCMQRLVVLLRKHSSAQVFCNPMHALTALDVSVTARLRFSLVRTDA
jgi:hypothetical protein